MNVCGDAFDRFVWLCGNDCVMSVCLVVMGV